MVHNIHDWPKKKGKAMRRGKVVYLNSLMGFVLIKPDDGGRLAIGRRLNFGTPRLNGRPEPYVKKGALLHLPPLGSTVFFRSGRIRGSEFDHAHVVCLEAHLEEARRRRAFADLTARDIADAMMPEELRVRDVQRAPYNDASNPDSFGMWNGVIAPIPV